MKVTKLAKLAIAFVLILTVSPMAKAGVFDLDSIATWGKFPRFVVNTYRWGDKFFNGYDSTYVVGTGTKFHTKFTTDSWFDYYNFLLPDKQTLHLRSDPSSSFGVHLGYLAVSVGYDVNFSKLFSGDDRARKRLRFGFNCSLLAFEAYFVSNDVGTVLTRYGQTGSTTRLRHHFNGINTSMWGLDAYYFFNHKRYSEAASFNYSKIQRRSQGSFYTGVSFYTQKYNFDFNDLPTDIRSILPTEWPDYKYYVKSNNYAVRLGYGYNWVFKPHWVMGVSESPILGICKGFHNSEEEKTSVSLYNRFKMSVVWNNKRWFAGMIGKMDMAIASDKTSILASAVFSGEACIGYRFNLW
jgi:hypothetical protein